MSATLTMILPFPPSVNSMYANVRGKGRVKTDRYKTWKQAAKAYLVGQKIDAFFGKDVPLVLTIHYHKKSNKDGSKSAKKWDVSNLVKAPEDFLVDMEMIADDQFIEEVRLIKNGDTEPGTCKIIVQELRALNSEAA